LHFKRVGLVAKLFDDALASAASGEMVELVGHYISLSLFPALLKKYKNASGITSKKSTIPIVLFISIKSFPAIKDAPAK
jgi:hypothetical protein